MKKKNKGITLIALVITIIVLIILAGVSISLVLGENGIITKAKQAKENMELAQTEEQTKLNELYVQIEAEGGTTGGDDVKTTVKAAGIQPSSYGTVVSNYTEGNQVWEIFYADDNNVYLITQGALNASALSITNKDGENYNGTSDIVADLAIEDISQRQYPASEQWMTGLIDAITNDSFTNEMGSMQGTQYLLDKDIWSAYVNNTYAEYAIGGPTIELLSASLKKSGKDEISYSIYGFGYKLNNYTSSNSILSDTVWNRGTGYWLASPWHGIGASRISFMDSSYGNINWQAYNSDYNFRPVVRLKSDVTLTLNDAQQYEISLSQ